MRPPLGSAHDLHTSPESPASGARTARIPWPSLAEPAPWAALHSPGRRHPWFPRARSRASYRARGRRPPAADCDWNRSSGDIPGLPREIPRLRARSSCSLRLDSSVAARRRGLRQRGCAGDLQLAHHRMDATPAALPRSTPTTSALSSAARAPRRYMSTNPNCSDGRPSPRAARRAFASKPCTSRPCRPQRRGLRRVGPNASSTTDPVLAARREKIEVEPRKILGAGARRSAYAPLISAQLNRVPTSTASHDRLAESPQSASLDASAPRWRTHRRAADLNLPSRAEASHPLPTRRSPRRPRPRPRRVMAGSGGTAAPLPHPRFRFVGLGTTPPRRGQARPSNAELLQRDRCRGTGSSSAALPSARGPVPRHRHRRRRRSPRPVVVVSRCPA